MKIADWLSSNVDYTREVAGSAIRGAKSGGESAGYEIAPWNWKLAVAVTCAGMVGGYLANRRDAARSVAAGGVIGAALGVTSALVWSGRRTIGAMAEGASKSISAAQDAHWLAKNPVAYG